MQQEILVWKLGRLFWEIKVWPFLLYLKQIKDCTAYKMYKQADLWYSSHHTWCVHPAYMLWEYPNIYARDTHRFLWAGCMSLLHMFGCMQRHTSSSVLEGVVKLRAQAQWQICCHFWLAPLASQGLGACAIIIAARTFFVRFSFNYMDHLDH